MTPILKVRQSYINGLVQERHNSIVNALELRLSCTDPSICKLVRQHLYIVMALKKCHYYKPPDWKLFNRWYVSITNIYCHLMYQAIFLSSRWDYKAGHSLAQSLRPQALHFGLGTQLPKVGAHGPCNICRAGTDLTDLCSIQSYCFIISVKSLGHMGHWNFCLAGVS